MDILSSQEDHDWHLFDMEKDYEVRRVGDTYEVRACEAYLILATLTPEEFEQLRQGGSIPKGLA